jgi:hypothetical protein
MGTSVSQRSPNTGGWRAVSACYTGESIPIDRTAVEIWRAASKQDNSLIEQLGSSTVAACVDAANRSPTPESAAITIEEISRSKENTVVGEFAKRMLMVKASGGAPADTPVAALFRQLTDYYVSRDIPGFVGANFRCKTISELRHFKQKIADIVSAKVQAAEREGRLSGRSWAETYRVVLHKLQE